MNYRCICFGMLLLGMVISISVEAADFSLTSPELKDGDRLTEKQLFNGFGCKGGNVSPELVWHNTPENTKSYAVTVYDPDAPTGSGWWHWVMFDIPADVSSIKENAGDETSGQTPVGSVQSRTDFGTSGYGGACPPAGHGEHRYIFTVYALDTKKLTLDKKASAAMVGFFVGQHTIAKAELELRYSR